MDHGGDDGHVEGLAGNLGAIDDVVEELLAAAGLAAGLIPRLAGWVGGERAAIRVFFLRFMSAPTRKTLDFCLRQRANSANST